MSEMRRAVATKVFPTSSRVVIRAIVLLLTALVLISWILSYACPHGRTVTGFRHYGICARDGRIWVYRVITTDVATSQRPGVGYVDVRVYEVKYRQLNPSLRGDAPMLVATPAFGRPIVGAAYYISGGEAPSFSERPDHSLTVTYVPYGITCDERSLPHWVLAAVLFGPALLSLRAWLASRRQRADGSCVRCGYDLRATPDQCPECGLEAAVRTAIE